MVWNEIKKDLRYVKFIDWDNYPYSPVKFTDKKDIMISELLNKIYYSEHPTIPDKILSNHDLIKKRFPRTFQCLQKVHQIKTEVIEQKLDTNLVNFRKRA